MKGQGDMAEVDTSPALLGRVFAGLDDVGVAWALLRGRDTLMDAKDVDLLVREDHLDGFEDLVFELGGLRLPGSPTSPWHRFYELSDRGSGTRIRLDVVTRLIYNRELRLESGLEDGCLERRVSVGGLFTLDGTDTFWTVLLHSVLDKEEVTQRRRAELESLVDVIRRPSPGEELFEALCPAGWSPDRALACVRDRDLESLSRLGREIVASRKSATATASREGTAGAAKPRLAGRARRRLGVQGRPAVVRRAAETAYSTGWRRTGLGTVPHVLDLVEAASVDGTVLSLRRRPARCEVVLLVPDEQRELLENRLRGEHYLGVAGRWSRLTAVGLESVELVSVSQRGLSTRAFGDIRDRSLPIGSRRHCRRAVGPVATQVARANGQTPRASTPRPETTGTRGRRQVKVSFSGLDGAGKSTQIKALVAALEGERRRTEVLWARFGFWPEWAKSRVPAGIGAWLRREKAGGERKPTGSTSSGRRAGSPPREGRKSLHGAASPLRTVFFAVLGTVWAVGGGWNLRRYVSASDAEVVVLDRYRLDSSMKLKYWNDALSLAWLDRIVRTLAPEPDLEFLLRLEPEAAYARKPEQWSVRQLTRQAKLYDELAAGPGRVITLDATKDHDELAREVWDRVRPLLNGRH
jgi:thymidylate kinase